MTLEWLNAELTRARVTCEAKSSRWWRRRYVVAEVEREAPPPGMWRSYSDWRFVVGGDRVVDHDDSLAHQIEEQYDSACYWQEKAAERAKLKNPWSLVEPLPPARTVKR